MLVLDLGYDTGKKLTSMTVLSRAWDRSVLIWGNGGEPEFRTTMVTRSTLTFEGHAISLKGLYPHFPCRHSSFSSRSKTGFTLFGVLHDPLAFVQISSLFSRYHEG